MNLKSMSLSQKIAMIISCLAVAIWLFYKIKPDLFPVDPTCPAIALFTLCEAVACWSDRRKWAYILIAGAVISVVCFILELTL